MIYGINNEFKIFFRLGTGIYTFFGRVYIVGFIYEIAYVFFFIVFTRDVSCMNLHSLLSTRINRSLKNDSR